MRFSSSGPWDQLKGPHEPLIYDLIFITNRQSSLYLVVNASYLSLRWVIGTYTRWSNITADSGV